MKSCSCTDYIEIFPYLREPVIENSTHPEYLFCNHTLVANKTAASKNPHTDISAIDGLQAADAFIYSASKVFGIRVRFRKSSATDDSTLAMLQITIDYQFLRKADFRNEGGRLIAGSYCDYYFFASTDDAVARQLLAPWLHFHSPRFPANYPAHIKCSYKFIGRPESRVEIIFEELQIPRQPQGCNPDKLTVFDSEAANMNAVIDVLCDALPSRRIISSGPDLLIEFNASSNLTAKGFRGKFRFPQSGVQRVPVTGRVSSTPAKITTTEKANVTLKRNSMWKSPTTEFMITADGRNSYRTLMKTDDGICKHTYDSRNKKSGIFDTSSLYTAIIPNVIIPIFTILPGTVQCRYEFQGEPFERVQIKFIDFNIPSEQNNYSLCNPEESSLQLLAPVHGTFEVAELYCGSFIPKPIMSKDNKLHLQFVGKYPLIGAKTTYYGFKAEYIFRKNFGITTGIQQGTDCVFMYNSTLAKSGWFSSPNFPGLYPQNIICSYYFYGELEELILIRFTYFDVEGIGTCEFSTASDHVEFSNYLSTDRKYAKICGKRDAFEVRSDGRFFRVSFYSNDRFDKTGFRAFYDFESKLTAVDNTSVQSYVGNSAKTIFQEYHWIWSNCYGVRFAIIIIFLSELNRSISIKKY